MLHSCIENTSPTNGPQTARNKAVLVLCCFISSLSPLHFMAAFTAPLNYVIMAKRDNVWENIIWKFTSTFIVFKWFFCSQLVQWVLKIRMVFITIISIHYRVSRDLKKNSKSAETRFRSRFQTIWPF